MGRLGASRERGGGARRDGPGGRDRGARLARRCGRGREPVVAPRPLRRRRARPRHGRRDAAPRLARRAPLARAPRGGAAGGRRAGGGGPRPLARLGSRLSRSPDEPPHAGRRARRDRAPDARTPGLRRLPPRRPGRARARARARTRLRADRARGGRRLRRRRRGADGRGRGRVRLLPARQRGRRARALPDHGAARGGGERGPPTARRRGARRAQPAPQRLPRRRHAPSLPRRDARRPVPRAPRLQHRAPQRRAARHHGAVRRARLRHHPALPEHPAARLSDPRAVRRPRLPALADRGPAAALRGRQQRAAHPERRRAGARGGARLMSGRHHLYLVPGFFGFTNLGELRYFAHVLDFLGARSRALGVRADIHVVRTHPTASLPQRAARVVETLAETMGRAGAVHVIGHSSGGLDARLAVAPGVSLPSDANVERVARRVRTVITVATPHHGTPLASFFARLCRDQALLPQLTPEGLELFNATTRDRPGVRYGSVVTRARPPGVRSTLAAGLDPSAQATHALYQALYRLASRTPRGQVPALAPAQARWLRRAYGTLPGPGANDGIVPTRSQPWGDLIHAAQADHLDVIGHFRDRAKPPRHTDWLTTGSGFDAEHFEALWADVAGYVLGRR